LLESESWTGIEAWPKREKPPAAYQRRVVMGPLLPAVAYKRQLLHPAPFIFSRDFAFEHSIVITSLDSFLVSSTSITVLPYTIRHRSQKDPFARSLTRFRSRYRHSFALHSRNSHSFRLSSRCDRFIKLSDSAMLLSASKQDSNYLPFLLERRVTTKKQTSLIQRRSSQPVFRLPNNKNVVQKNVFVQASSKALNRCGVPVVRNDCILLRPEAAL
jgi:hypothetical protein